MQTYQIHTTTGQSAMAQTVVMSSPMSQTKSDDPTMKREIRLAKNRCLSLDGLFVLFFFFKSIVLLWFEMQNVYVRLTIIKGRHALMTT